mgnify:CR=1 FL=1
MAIKGGRISKQDKDLIAESRAFKAAAQRKALRSAHAKWRGDALQEIGLKEDGKMRRQVERRAAAQALQLRPSCAEPGQADAVRTRSSGYR